MTDPKQPGVEEAPAEFDADYDEHSAQADADAAAGRVVPHERVRQWLQSIIDGKPEPTPYSWRK
jgi:predicted transcriptional regulator